MKFSRCNLMASVTAATSLLAGNAIAFVNRPLHHGMPHVRTSVAYRTNTENDVLETTSSTAAPLAPESFLWEDPTETLWNGQKQQHNGRQEPPSVAELAQRLESSYRLDHDPSLVEFVPSERYNHVPKVNDHEVPQDDDHYPYAAMLQGSAHYIANHLGEIAVFYIPGEWLHKPNQLFDSFLEDVSLARLMGMKIVLVADCRLENDASCGQDIYDHPHECHNSLRVTTDENMRQMEEEAGYIRFEVERKMNRFLKKHLVYDRNDQEGNVVGGNMFYSARAFGKVPGSDEDFEHTGFVQRVYTDNIRQALDNNDVVLLTTVGCSMQGESVNVNGQHLAASVAASLNAYKLIYMANQGSVLSEKESQGKFFQEIPLSFAQQLCDYHKVRVHKTGFANFEHARQRLPPRAVELLLNLAWGSWAIDQGVTRAHVVNPKDGALLEELFTSKNGANTCLYHDDENLTEDDAGWLDAEDTDDWNEFFSEAAAQETL
ncbi:Amino-acid acetyltransferase [Seminavis robusta]|uniref:Amino-acid acetyltransferase n=1 Tax=Seminavis robusta TaxID=568900 RepID=A0A9N8E5R1_9STRA|nr:Amino-acid acetyltransferase [Seminavis robusta]|eukprot:Sro526_g160390.1 Amino-acid acetyltransferase (489) ;mRNA; f:31017-32483